MTVEEYNAIGSDIIGASFQVRNNVGSGLKEKFYELALAYELRKKGHKVDTQVAVPALYCGEKIGDAFQADMIVDDAVIIELKAISVMTEVESRQLFTYLKLSDYKLGYLINFGAKNFSVGRNDEKYPLRLGIYRIVNKL